MQRKDDMSSLGGDGSTYNKGDYALVPDPRPLHGLLVVEKDQLTVVTTERLTTIESGDLKHDKPPPFYEAYLPQPEKDSKVFYSRWTLFLMLCSCAILIILESIIMWRLRFLYTELNTIKMDDKLFMLDLPQNSTSQEIIAGSLYHSSFIAATLFLVYVTWDAVIQQNIIQVIAISAYSFGNFVFSCVQISQNHQTEADYANFATFFNEMDASVEDGIQNLTMANEGDVLPMEVGVVVVTLIWWITITGFSYFLYLEFGWRIYRKIGGNIALENDFRNYHVFLLCNKYSLLFECMFAVFVLVASTKTLTKWATTLFGIPVVIAALFAGYLGVRQENVTYLRFVQFANVAMSVYVIFYLTAAYKSDGQDYEDFRFLRTPMTFFGCLALLLLVGSTVFSHICFKRFGNGLKEILEQQRRWHAEPMKLNLDD
ncbi:hypothetical protein HK101_010813 [Irineochytrium annulatum]|nr:hypothetical protein HK101_010813 [Irineochytrium annulatum]